MTAPNILRPKQPTIEPLTGDEATTDIFEDQPISSELQATEKLIAFREEMSRKGELDAETVKDLCHTMRNFVTDGLVENAAKSRQDEVVSRLLNTSFEDSRVKEVEFRPGLTSAMRKGGTITIGQEMFEGKSKLLENDKAFHFRHPDDQRFLEAVHLISHEVSHGITQGIDAMVARDTGVDTVDTTKDYLLRHPDTGFTGNLQTDTAILCERFGEAGRIIAMQKTMRLLGYEEPEVNHYLPLVAHTPRLRTIHKRGATQFDVLSQVTTHKALHELVSSDADEIFKLQGYLGYAKPLTPSQAVDLLRDAAVEEHFAPPDYHKKLEYLTSVKAAHSNPDAEVPAYLKQVQEIRNEDLKEQRETRIPRAIGRLVSSRTGRLLGEERRTKLAGLFPKGRPLPQLTPTRRTVSALPSKAHIHVSPSQAPKDQGMEYFSQRGFTVVMPKTDGQKHSRT